MSGQASGNTNGNSLPTELPLKLYQTVHLLAHEVFYMAPQARHVVLVDIHFGANTVCAEFALLAARNSSDI